MLVLAHRRRQPRAHRRTPSRPWPRRSSSVPTGWSSTSTAPPTARSSSATTPTRPIGPLGDLTLADLAAPGSPRSPSSSAVLDVCRGRLVNVEVKDSDPRAADALVALLASRSVAAVGAPGGGRDDVLVSSFDVATVDRVRGRRTPPPDRVPLVRAAARRRPRRRRRPRPRRGAPRRVDAHAGGRPRVRASSPTTSASG